MNTQTTHKPHTLIGLVGLAGSGKDTVADMLLTCWWRGGHSTAIRAFAEPIRAMCGSFLFYAGVHSPERYLTDRSLKEEVIPEVGVSYRQLAQTLGTEWGQQCLGRGIWIRVMEQRLRALDQRLPATRIVIPDVRFSVEADWVRAQGGVIWRVERPGVAPVREHVSESGTTEIKANRVIVNSGTLDDLRSQVGYELAVLDYERNGLVKSTEQGGQ